MPDTTPQQPDDPENEVEKAIAFDDTTDDTDAPETDDEEDHQTQGA